MAMERIGPWVEEAAVDGEEAEEVTMTHHHHTITRDTQSHAAVILGTRQLGSKAGAQAFGLVQLEVQQLAI
jgi:hypothetical protein